MSIQIKKIPAEATWQIRHQVMWPNEPLNYVKLPDDQDGLHFGLFRDNELITVCSLFLKDNVAQFRKLATRTPEQGKGYGSQMLDYLLKQAQRRGVEKIWCNARCDKAVFYQKFGLIKTRTTFTKGGIDYVIMKKKLS